MDQQKAQILEKLKQANNILVTVSTNPTVDQLSAAIGLTVFLNHMGKHASAVFSGTAPSTIEFLQPEKTLEKTTDSLRDFIIALDKSKADKLRYKVEDQMVKIFITPYQTSITEKDLEFSHGDFNVEAVIALGVKEQGDLDQAITAHGRILHDATVIGVGTQEPVSLGSINWNDSKASSLCEMITSLSLDIRQDALDGQMATALLTGIVAETERFSNEKTSSETMQLSAKLMAAGANQQLVASQLEQPEQPAPQPDTPEPDSVDDKPQADDDSGVAAELPEPKDDDTGDSQTPEPPKPDEKEAESASDGSLHINHGGILPFDTEENESDESKEQALGQIHIENDGTLKYADEMRDQATENTPTPPSDTPSRMVLQPPTLDTKLTANTEPESLDPSTDPLSTNTPQSPLLSHDSPASPSAEESVVIEPTVPANESLSDLEAAVNSPHTDAPAADLGAARDAVNQAAAAIPPTVVEPVQALNAQPMDLNQDPQVGIPPAIQEPPTVVHHTQSLIPPDPGLPADPTAPQVADPTAPPPVPPPMMPPVEAPVDNSPSATAL